MNSYVSKVTGEICDGFFHVLRTIWIDFWHFHVINFRWEKWEE